MSEELEMGLDLDLRSTGPCMYPFRRTALQYLYSGGWSGYRFEQNQLQTIDALVYPRRFDDDTISAHS